MSRSQDAKDIHEAEMMKFKEHIENWPRKAKERLLLEVTEYRSSENSIGSVYMGGMAHASLRHTLGDKYPGTVPYADLITSVDDDTLMRGIESVASYIDYMLKNPRTHCPCCGQIVKGE